MRFARSIGMRWICVLLLSACAFRQTAVQRDKLEVEEVAIWFMRAALAGDEATATSLSLQSYLAQGIVAKAQDQTAWDAKIQEVVAQLGKEGDNGGDVASAQVVERMTLSPKDTDKVLREVKVAVVKINVRDPDGKVHAGLPWMFVKTEQGWKFSPK